MSTDLKELENRLWQAADNLRANSKLSSYEYSTPVLGLIFLRYASHRFKPLHEKLEQQVQQMVEQKRIADVKVTIERELDQILPDKYDRQLFAQMCNEVFDHVYQRY